MWDILQDKLVLPLQEINTIVESRSMVAWAQEQRGKMTREGHRGAF